ncbi:MAG TPA: substrate-binding domain-containing protein [Mycobacteriales bacterium]
MVSTRKLKTLGPLLLVGAMALGACSSSGDNKSDDGSNKSGGTIGVSVPTVEGPFFTAMLYGITDEAEKAGYDVTILSAGGYGKVDTQVGQIETLIAKNVDILMVDPADPTVTRGPIERAVAQGITVVGAGDPAPGANGSASAAHCDVGKDLAKGAETLLPDGGEIGVLAGPAGAHWSTERLRCFKEAIADTDLKIITEQATDPDVAKGLSTASDFLQRFPTIDLLYGADDTVGVGAAKAVEAANKCDKTLVLTAVFGEQAESLMKKNCVNYDVALQPVLIGREAVKLAVAIKSGDKPAETELAVPTVAVTPENVSTVDISTIRAPENWKPKL